MNWESVLHPIVPPKLGLNSRFDAETEQVVKPKVDEEAKLVCAKKMQAKQARFNRRRNI